MDIYQKVRADYYKTKLPYGENKSDVRKIYYEDQNRLDVEFKADLFKEFDVESNPKKDLCFSKAYEMGHAHGYSEVLNYFSDFVDLIK